MHFVQSIEPVVRDRTFNHVFWYTTDQLLPYRWYIYAVQAGHFSSLTNAIHCCSYSFESTPSGRTGKLLGMGFILPRGLRTFENMSNSELHPSPYAGPHCQNFRQMHIWKVRNASNIQPQVGIGNSVAISGDIPPVYRAERYLGLTRGHCQRR